MVLYWGALLHHIDTKLIYNEYKIILSQLYKNSDNECLMCNEILDHHELFLTHYVKAIYKNKLD